MTMEEHCIFCVHIARLLALHNGAEQLSHFGFRRLLMALAEESLIFSQISLLFLLFADPTSLYRDCIQVMTLSTSRSRIDGPVFQKRTIALLRFLL